jgi:hypothetical protein
MKVNDIKILAQKMIANSHYQEPFCHKNFYPFINPGDAEAVTREGMKAIRNLTI